MSFPLQKRVLDQTLQCLNITDISLATIRQSGDIARLMEEASGENFLHLEMGVPGMAPDRVGTEAEIEALCAGVAAVYPSMFGIPALKKEASRFIKAFLDTDVSPQGCIATVGSMQGSFAAFMLCANMVEGKDTILFIDPGFNVQKTQTQILGIPSETFDIYDFRGDKLRQKLESYLSKGNIAAIVYSNPNNPAWICLTEEELRIIGELATEYEAVVIEDLAYFCMDFRKDLGKPFQAPFQATASKYTDNYILLLSGSKVFSYAGQRVAVAAISDALLNRSYDKLERKFNMSRVGDAYALTILYAASAGVSHSAQCAMAAMFAAASDGRLDFVGSISEYGRRAAIAKRIFERHGFRIVYDRDMDEPVSDGFFFTVGYSNFTGPQLMSALFLYGICSVSLDSMGSCQRGVRVCISQINHDADFDVLDRRLELFSQTINNN